MEYTEFLKKELTEQKLNITMVGKHNDVPDSKFDPKELKMGISVEKEHTDQPDIAIRIAKDHLSEFPDYYSRLEKMEDEAKKHWNKKGLD